jgi:ribosomal-protein-alanine N-acetyltransferase
MVRGRSVTECWRFRAVSQSDIGGLHALACQPLIYRYLFDNAAPECEFIAKRVTQAITNAATAGLGMWILEGRSKSCAGSVELRPYPLPNSAEITYLLHPDNWRQGLATRMAWTAITRAFASPHIDYIVAGHDLPNAASSAVMRRLGMRFHRNVRYPLGAGAEYILHRDDAGPMPRPALIPLP